MLEAFRKKGAVGCCVFYIIIYHRKGCFSSARMRMREKKKKKRRKPPERGFPGDLTLCLKMAEFAIKKNGEDDFCRIFFEKMTVPRLNFRRSAVSYSTHFFCGRSKMVMLQLPKLATPVRFRSPAPFFSFYSGGRRWIGVIPYPRRNRFPSRPRASGREKTDQEGR